MKVSILTSIVLLFSLSISAQWGNNFIKLSENITTETRKFSGFKELNFSEDFKVFIEFSETDQNVQITANENLHALINVSQQGEALNFNLESYSTQSGNCKKCGASEKLEVHITMSELKELTADEDVIINFENKLTTDELKIALTEDCVLRGEIETKRLELSLDEDCSVKFRGSTNDMKATIVEDSFFKGKDFEVESLKIFLDEDSFAKIKVSKDIDLVAKDDSIFYNEGNASFSRKRLLGDSEVR